MWYLSRQFEASHERVDEVDRATTVASGRFDSVLW